MAKEKLSAKQKKVLDIIKHHPEGIALWEMGYIMGVAFITLTKDVKKLLTEGKIKKEGNKYLKGG